MPPPAAASAGKSKEDRVRETITILNKLKEVGIADTEPGYQEVKRLLSKWVHDGEAATYKVEFHRFGRRAELVLPTRADRTVSLALKTI